MFYSFLKFIIQKSLVVHYRKVYGINLSAVPKKGPLILATNHPNTFLDAIVVASLIQRPLHFLSKGEAHSKRWIHFILKAFNLIPIYRVSKGIDNYNKNQKTFIKCHEILKKDGAILIFPEGISIPKKKVNPLKKGLAHIALGFLDNTDSRAKLSIIPVGINYDQLTKFNNNIYVSFGTPFLINPWIEEYRNNHNQAFISFNENLLFKLQKHVIETEEEDEILLQTLYEVNPTEEESAFNQKKLILQKIKDFKEKEAQLYPKLNALATETREILDFHKLSLKQIHSTTKLSTKDLLINILLLPLSLFGLIFSLWPFFIAKQLAKKIPYPEYRHAARFGIATISWLIYIIILTILLSNKFGELLLFSPIIFYWSLLSYRGLYKALNKVSQINQKKKLKANAADYNKVTQNFEKIKEIAHQFQLTTIN